MTTKIHRALYSVILVASLPVAAHAVNPANWTIVEQILRTDTTKSWVSPTAVDLGKMVWLYDFEITKMTGTVNVPILGDVTQDITSSIPPEMRMGSGESSNLPAVVLTSDVAHADSGSSAHLLIAIDSLGFGRGEFSNIVLGSINVPFIGNRPIQRLNMEGNVTVIGYDFGDFNRDGAVNAADYVIWRKGNGSLADYDLWRGHFGPISVAPAQMGTAVPEPASALLLLCGTVLGMGRGRRLPVKSKGRRSIREKSSHS